MTEKPYHLLITRLSAIGDCILTLPLATAVKRALPEAKISWIVSCRASQLIELCPDVDQVIKVPRRWLASPRQWQAIRKTLHASPIDCVLDPQSLSKSSLIGPLSGAPLRIGFASPRGREVAPWINNRLVQPKQDEHLVDATLRLTECLDITPGEANFQIQIPQEVVSWTTDWLKEAALRCRPVVLNPGGAWKSKQWPAERFAKVAKWLKNTHQITPVIIWAGDLERQLAQEICQLADQSAMLAPATDLIQLASLLEQSQLIITGDTGPTHLAAAMGTRCISLHGATNPVLSGPYGSQHLRIQKVQRIGTGRQRRDDDNSAMLAIQVEDVCDAIDTHFSSTSHRLAA